MYKIGSNVIALESEEERTCVVIELKEEQYFDEKRTVFNDFDKYYIYYFKKTTGDAGGVYQCFLSAAKKNNLQVKNFPEGGKIKFKGIRYLV